MMLGTLTRRETSGSLKLRHAQGKISSSSLFQLSHQGTTGPPPFVAGIVPPVCGSGWSVSLAAIPTFNHTPESHPPDVAIALQFSLLDALVGRLRVVALLWLRTSSPIRYALVSRDSGGRVVLRTRQRGLGAVAIT